MKASPNPNDVNYRSDNLPYPNLQLANQKICLPIGEQLHLFRVTVGNNLKFDKHITKICRKVSQEIAVLKCMKNMLPLETRKAISLFVFYCPTF